MVDWPRPEVSGHLLNEGNVGLVFMRQVASGDDYSHFIVSRIPVDARACYSNKGIMTIAPLYLHESMDRERGMLALGGGGKRPNFTPTFLHALRGTIAQTEESSPAPEEIFNYMYAVFSSPTYRTRYQGLLKIDFPRLPLTSNLELFHALSSLGKELVALHLMESTKLSSLITNWRGSTPSSEVEKITYIDTTVWIDKGRSQGFTGVRENVWDFRVGGYQVCDKWLKDRKGRTLSAEDITHYQKIVVALSETIHLMEEIDMVIEKHGGWPGAFTQAQQTIRPGDIRMVEGNAIIEEVIQIEGKSNKREEAQVEIILTKDKETPGTWRYKEKKEDHPLTIYLTKEQVKELGDPETIKITVTAA